MIRNMGRDLNWMREAILIMNGQPFDPDHAKVLEELNRQCEWEYWSVLMRLILYQHCLSHTRYHLATWHWRKRYIFPLKDLYSAMDQPMASIQTLTITMIFRY